MNNHNISDTSITNPDNDLLGMKPQAEKLARFITEVQPPFIIGIYGQWGEGKTSYVQLAHYYLEQSAGRKVIYVPFTAWPFTSSDEIWRALTLEIGRKVCASSNPGDASKDQAKKDPATPPPEPPMPEADTWQTSLTRFLHKDAFVVWKEEEPPAPVSPCDTLEASLNEGLRRSISRRPEKQYEINQEAALAALFNSALAAIGNISPLFAGLRGLLGFKTDTRLAEIVQEKKDKASQEDLKSIDALKRTLKDLFDGLEKDKLVLVFVDDLDRCLPDVALDLLEAIKIFFEGVEKCIFLVAADKTLIGQGLRLRYKDLFDSGDAQKTEELLNRKGNEYFEKVVQFGVTVPQRTPEQIHKFITAQYPRWMAATDIIAAAVGNNPRRLKQYCTVLSFAYEASRTDGQSG